MKQLLLIVLLALICFQNSQEQTLHAFIVAASHDHDKDLQRAININLEEFANEIKLIGQNTDLSIKLYDYTEGNFNSESLRNTISNFYCSPNDIIMFYYVGHGFRFKNQSDKWPVLAVSYDINTNEDLINYGVPFKFIVDNLRSKNSRLLISIAECCNLESGYHMPIDHDDKGQISLSFAIRQKERFQELYEYSRGEIIVSSSKPGETSKGNTTHGAYFSNAFMEIHKELTSISNNASWNDLIEKSFERTQSMARLRGFVQTPQWEININTIKINTNKWKGVISDNKNVFHNQPANFTYQNPYFYYKYPIARIVMFDSNRVFFLMSDNYIVEYNPVYGNLVFKGYRSFTGNPQLFAWDIINPVSPYHQLIYGVDIYGQIWTFNNFSGWKVIGIVYY